MKVNWQKQGNKLFRVVMCLQCRKTKLLVGVWPDDVCGIAGSVVDAALPKVEVLALSEATF